MEIIVIGLIMPAFNATSDQIGAKAHRNLHILYVNMPHRLAETFSSLIHVAHIRCLHQRTLPFSVER